MAALPAKPPLKGEVPAAGGRRGSPPYATKVAAALSAAVTIPPKTGKRAQLARVRKFIGRVKLISSTPTLAGRGGSVSRRDHNPQNRETRPTRKSAQVRRKSQAYSPPLFGWEREEGKDSHSRQWRLSMAVFLNRNKRP